MRSIEFFSCSGGMAEGFRRAGVTFDLAFDADPDACESYEKNLGHRPIQMDVRDLLRMVEDGWRPGALDLLVADPPCTPYSRAGKRLRTADPRDMLGRTAELIRILRPRAYLIGNVPGLQDATAWHIVQEVLGGMSKHGYCTADYISLDAADYGVPQRRIRPFWFGHLGGECIRWPEPTHAPPTTQLSIDGRALVPWVTCRQALGHLPAKELGRPVRIRWKEYDKAKGAHKPSEPDKPARTLTRNTNGDGSLLAHPRHPPSSLDAPSHTVTTKGDGRGAQGACVLQLAPSEPTTKKRPPSTQGEQWSRIHSADAPSPTVLTDSDRTTGNGVKLEWPWDRPATTVSADERIPPPGHHGESFLSQPNAIVLSERAAAILQGFPEEWVFSGETKKARWSQLGQAMPPALAHAVASSIVRWFERAEKTEGAA